ncbi:RagB/SusD family nutrient uptake outer membrane protein [Pseudochryseolinea flava]|uniref:RagB/SusD family nutrient uptake outer membrane protein n=1 Tax=Pseudochryseolinea flava TaxID=2059302 RepID=A0A364XYA7_9BACT|nr:RagB/SusD family nutrient uptake outer membrane protein [Pseudochryseolinea flava]RAV99285.1 RagB/SusD family nutrient uptake outer membrane protein [Pseudochryseolinea flava]
MKKINISLTVLALLFTATSCLDDLNQEPLNKKITTANNVYKDPASYKQFLAKLYGALTLTGQRGEFGQPEINAPDEGTTSFLRTYWSAQEITTDECISAWGDPGLVEFHGHNWSEQNSYVELLYQRIFINIAYCNEYIREVTPRIDGLSADMQPEVTRFVAEARFLRALYYYFALDLWGNVPFVTEADATGAFLPKQISRANLFAYIESELKSIEPMLADAGLNEYARADKAAAWMLLAKLYLNAEAYLGTETKKYSECIAECKKIIASGKFTLNDSYEDLFLADNHTLRNEIIFPIAEDGDNTRNYGGMTFVIHAAVGGQMDADNGFGIASGGWNGNRFTNTFVEKFADTSGETDTRAMFFTDGQILEIEHPTTFTEGYLSTKFKNITSTGAKGKNATFVDTDFPLFRLADVYLMYAEAVKRDGTGGSIDDAVDYVNAIRERAYGDDSGNISSATLTLDFILDERARELHWEAHRRTDLIRFKKFTGDSYVWDWKGNVKDGASTAAHTTIFPLPASDRAVNTNLDQNPGY